MTKEFKGELINNEIVEKSIFNAGKEVGKLSDITAETFINGLDVPDEDIKKILFEDGHFDKIMDQRDKTLDSITDSLVKAHKLGIEEGKDAYREKVIKDTANTLIIVGLAGSYVKYRKPINKFIKNNVSKLKNKFKKKDSVKDIEITRYDDVEEL